MGYFVWMLGAGVLFDSEADGVAMVLLGLGGGMFALGTVQSILRAGELKQ